MRSASSRSSSSRRSRRSSCTAASACRCFWPGRGRRLRSQVTAVLFGLGHGLVLSLAAFVWFGIVIALVRLRTDSIYPAFAVHCAFNAIGMTAPSSSDRLAIVVVHLMAGPDSADPLIRQLREQLSDNDVAIVEALNVRLKLVARLKRVKENVGSTSSTRPARSGCCAVPDAGEPRSAHGRGREIYTELLDLTKREVARGDER